MAAKAIRGRAESHVVPIDVWNVATFDEALLAELNARRDLLRDYELTSKRNFLEQQAAKGWVRLGPALAIRLLRLASPI
jgi:hypothetical protein